MKLTRPVGWLEYDHRLNLHDENGDVGITAKLESKEQANELIEGFNACLTPTEQNLIKDILNIIGKDEQMNNQFAQALGMNEATFDYLADTVFNKCQNGRLTVVE